MMKQKVLQAMQTKKGGRVSKSGLSKFPGNDDSKKSSNGQNAAVYWEDRDKKSLTFVNFMNFVLRDQIQQNLTDQTMALEIGVDAKTFRAWRTFIQFSGVVDDLVEHINANYSDRLPVAMKRLKSLLVSRVESVDRGSVPKHRSHAGLPGAKAFENALEYATQTVLLRWASKNHPNEKDPLAIARAVADGFAWAYQYNPSRDIEFAWNRLVSKVGCLTSISTEMALLQATATFPGEHGVNATQLSRFVGLEQEIDSALESARQSAKNYFAALDEVVLGDDAWSEKSAGMYPVMPFAIADGVDDGHLLRVESLLDMLSKIRFVDDSAK